MNGQKEKRAPKRAQQMGAKKEARRAVEAEGIAWTPVAMGENMTDRHMGLKITAAVAVALAVLYVILCAVVKDTKILPRTYVNGVNISGMTQEQASKAIEEDFRATYSANTLQVKANGDTYVVEVGNALTMDCDALAAQALERSQDSFLRRGAQLVRAQVMGREIEQIPTIGDSDALHNDIEQSGLLAINTTVQTTSEVKGDQLIFVKGVTGNSVDEEKLAQAMENAVESDDYDSVIECPMVTGKVKTVDWEAVRKTLYQEPVSATLELSASKKKYTYVKSITGVNYSAKKAKAAIDAAQEGEAVAVDLVYTEPEITTKQLKKNLFKDCLGTYTTNVSGSAARVSNVKRAASTINNIILMSGDSLSYNNTLGERTAANGYQKAPAYSNGDTVYEYGGGICQVSSTLYASLLYANLQIDERHNHTYASSYIGLGMDATVSWGGPDLQFTNNQMYPIQIRASYSNGQLTVSIWGTNTENTTVKIKSETLETIAFKTETRTDSSRYEDESYVAQKGANGYHVQTYRIVYKDGKKVSTSKEAYSAYSTHTKIVYVGTMPRPVVVEPAPATDTTGTANATATTGTTSTTTTTTTKPTTAQ